MRPALQHTPFHPSGRCLRKPWHFVPLAKVGTGRTEDSRKGRHRPRRRDGQSGTALALIDREEEVGGRDFLRGKPPCWSCESQALGDLDGSEDWPRPKWKAELWTWEPRQCC